MTKTKEELVIENAKLDSAIKSCDEVDQQRRKEFAKDFHWYKDVGVMRMSYNADNREIRIPSWPEIYVEIGKLLSLRDFRDFEGNVSELEFSVRAMETKLNEKKDE